MRAIGVKLRMIVKIFVFQVLIVLVSSILSGLAIGLLVIYLFLISEPVVSATTVAYSIILYLLTTVFLALLSLVPLLRVMKKGIPEVLHPF